MDEDPRGRELKAIIARVRHPRGTTQRLRIVASQGPKHIMAYAYHQGFDFADYQPTNEAKAEDVDWPSVRFESKLPDTKWLCKRYSTKTGMAIESFELNSDDKGRLILSLNKVEPDAAFRMSLIEKQ